MPPAFVIGFHTEYPGGAFLFIQLLRAVAAVGVDVRLVARRVPALESPIELGDLGFYLPRLGVEAQDPRRDGGVRPEAEGREPVAGVRLVPGHDAEGAFVGNGVGAGPGRQE